MTTHHGLPVAGYRAQPTSNVDLVNRNKQIEERVLRILDELAALDGTDKRWLATGRTDIEKGFMAVNRAVFRPGRVVIQSDEVDVAAVNECQGDRLTLAADRRRTCGEPVKGFLSGEDMIAAFYAK